MPPPPNDLPATSLAGWLAVLSRAGHEHHRPWGIRARPGKLWQPEAGHPSINRIVCSDIPPEAHGNPGGPGLADFCTQRLWHKVDYKALYLNQVTSYSTMVANMPIALQNDQVAMAAALATTPERVATGRRLCAIKSTLELTDVLVSEVRPVAAGCVCHRAACHPMPLPRMRCVPPC